MTYRNCQSNILKGFNWVFTLGYRYFQSRLQIWVGGFLLWDLWVVLLFFVLRYVLKVLVVVVAVVELVLAAAKC